MPRVFRPEQLSMNAFSLYEHFRPAIAAEVRGWGAKGNLDIVDHVDHVDQLRAGFRGVTRRKLTPTKTLDFPTLSLRTRRPGVRISPGAPFFFFRSLEDHIQGFSVSRIDTYSIHSAVRKYDS